MLANKLPESLKRVLLKMYFYPVDPIGTLMGRGDSMIPPKRLQSSGGGDFSAIGKEYTKLLIETGGLKPTDSVLDVGCGIGRTAIFLTEYLVGGTYAGVDIMPHAVKWCKKRITKKHSNFQFHLADIYNGMYNRNGRYSASDYKFPYNDNSFDLVFLISVFTHLRRKESENYLHEVSRVLKSHGICFSTYFLLNEETKNKMKQGNTTLNFRNTLDRVSYSAYEDVPEIAIAYEEDYVAEQYKQNNLQIFRSEFGPWRDGGHPLVVQDTLVAKKLTDKDKR